MTNRRKDLLTFIVLLIMALLFGFPLYLVLCNSFKPYGEIFASPVALPASPTMDNFINAWYTVDYFQYFFNSVINVVIALALCIFFSSLAAYKLSRTKTRLSSLIFLYFTASMLLPFEVIMLPLVKTMKSLHLLNSLFGLSLVQASLSISFSIFLYHGFVKTIPTALDEAALIDGAGDLQVYFRIIVPLLKPITVTVIVLNTLSYWNNFLLPLLTLTKDDYKTLPLFSYSFIGQYSSNYDLQLPAIVLSGLPMVIFYLVLQKNIEKGIVAGSIKG